MKKMLIHLPLAAVLLLGIAAPATAANTSRTTNPNGIDSSSFGTDVRDGMNNMERYNQYSNGNGAGIGTTNGNGNNMDRSYNRNDNNNMNRAFNTDGNFDNTYRNNTYRARAAGNNNTTNWSWLGLLGLIGLAGMFRGSDNRSRT